MTTLIKCNFCYKPKDPDTIINYVNHLVCIECFDRLNKYDQERHKAILQSQQEQTESKTKDQVIKEWIEQTKAKVKRELELN